MFTGIIKELATVTAATKKGTNLELQMNSRITGELNVDQSVAHNGVCLTVTAINGKEYSVTAVAETLAKTTLGGWAAGDTVNMELALRAGDRLDGHFVQGHADTTGTCIEKKELDGSWLFRFGFAGSFAPLLIEKGSVCINGVSLTVFNVGKDEFTVTIIPYTYEHTNFNQLKEGDAVNLEFDVLGKYALRMWELNH